MLNKITSTFYPKRLLRTSAFSVFKLRFISYLLLAVAFISVGCDDDDAAPVELTILEQHRNELNTVNVNGNDITYLDYGSGDNVLILLHGIPTSSLLYRNVAPQLAEQTGFRVVAPDLLGFGDSDKPTGNGLYSMENQANLVYRFADALNINSFVLNLHDSGGFIGWQMMLQANQSDRIRGLIITDTGLDLNGFTPPPLLTDLFAQQATPEEVFLPLAEDEVQAKAAIRSFLEAGLFDKTLVTDELVEAYVAPMNETTQNYIELFQTLPTIVGQADQIRQNIFANFNKPVVIIWGEEDALLDVNIIARQFQLDFNLPDNGLNRLSNTGHYLYEENPNGYLEVAVPFLNNNF